MNSVGKTYMMYKLQHLPAFILLNLLTLRKTTFLDALRKKK